MVSPRLERSSSGNEFAHVVCQCKQLKDNTRGAAGHSQGSHQGLEEYFPESAET